MALTRQLDDSRFELVGVAAPAPLGRSGYACIGLGSVHVSTQLFVDTSIQGRLWQFNVTWPDAYHRASRVFCFEVEGLLVYPAFFVDPRYNVRQLESVCKRLGALPGGSKWQFFVTRKGSLGGVTPLEALLAGDFAAVMLSAEGFRDR